ncbi:putative bifunctional diguanylate cyclase/phosphodiesterase [Rhizobium halophytocola]|uniref:Diguanylate cyclase (GGDEF)-like protein n=1 Tax=Rhizobium halophytocola TaxID=735519 RepID=A0ABS4E362_9HYPH|nr:EAL domain-containing protein [Rhizobium halophytocola]MBP1852367.1 diguanylate cyclase (GGDEF)-like protein [Rhizobium halophytocola]
MLASTLFGKRARIEAAVLFSLCFGVWAVLAYFDLFELVMKFVVAHDNYQLDEVVLALVFVGLGSLMFSVLRSVELYGVIQARLTAEQDLDWLALHDPLTRLGNRHQLEKVVEAANRAPRKEPCIVHSIDLDGFKRVNDMLGHDVGDLALFEAARRLAQAYAGLPVYRAGGDEFIILQFSGDEGAGQAMAQAALDGLRQPLTLMDSPVELGASIGIAATGDERQDLRIAMQHADAAMYVAKRGGRNQLVRFEDSMNYALRRRISMEHGLRQALRDGSITPFYQPLIDLKSGDVNGFEALARWWWKGEEVPPAEFVTLAEETGLIVELGEQLLHKACAQAATWPAYITLAFNISPVQFRDPALGLRILQVLGETGLPAERLEIEITETALMIDPQQAEDMLAALQSAGIRVALDDFGTGFSSLSQLSRFRFDKIKIDRSFVVNFESDEKQAKIMRALLGLGHGLGLSTTAEGIESESQLKALTQLGCDVGQGYLFGRALPASAVDSVFFDGRSHQGPTRARQ